MCRHSPSPPIACAVGQLGLGGFLSYPNWKVVGGIGEAVVHIAAGESHCMAVGYDGNAYAWGLNNKGQLGLGHNNNAFSPARVKLPREVRVQLTSCGFRHSMLLCVDGRVFSVGGNTRGQLGNGNCFDTPAPFELPPSSWSSKDLRSGRFAKESEHGGERLEDTRLLGPKLPGAFPIQVSAGSSHSIVLTSDHVVFAFGNGADGRLGQGDDYRDKYIPVPVVALLSKHIVLAVAGESHSFAFTSKRELYRYVCTLLFAEECVG